MGFNIGPMTDSFLNKCREKLQDKKTKEKIVTYIINPIVSEVNDKYGSYIKALKISLLFIMITQIIIIYIIMSNK